MFTLYTTIKRGKNMKKRLILLLFVLFLLPLTVKALDVNVQATPIRSTVAPFQDALYNLKITNNENKAITFTITYLDISSYLKLSEGCIRTYISNLLKKNIPLTKTRLKAPTGPLRCLAMMISATPGSLQASLV